VATDKNGYLEGLEVENCDELDDVNGHLWVYTLKNINTKVIWTVHPNNLRFHKGMNVSKLVDILVKTVQEAEI
jgi:hypothetical protein